MKKTPYPITELTGGLDVNVDPIFLLDSTSPNVQNIRLHKGLVSKGFGSVLFGLPVLGRPMLLDTYYKVDGSSYEILLTTTSMYYWNDLLSEWEDLTPGEDVSDCEVAWTGSSHITASADTVDFKVGLKSVKLIVGADFTSGLAAYRDLSSIDLHTYTKIHLWIKSSIALNASDVSLVLDNTSGCVSPLETLALPAIEADTWTRVSLSLANAASDTAIISVGLVINVDKGAWVIHLDDIRACVEFTGQVYDSFSSAILNDTFIFTNGVDQVKKFNGTTVEDIGGSPPFTRAGFVFSHKSRLVFLDTTESGVRYPQKVLWTSVGTIETFTGGSSGYAILVDTIDWCMAGAVLKDKAFIFKERSIWDLNYVGGSTVFDPAIRVDGIGSSSPRSIVNLGETLAFYGPDDVYEFDGTTLEALGDRIYPLLYDTSDRIVDITYPKIIHGIYIEETNELNYLVPTSDSLIPDTLFTMKLGDKKAWTRKNSQYISCYGYHTFSQSHVTWTAAVGTWEDYLGTWKRASLPGYAPTTLLGWYDGQIREDDRSTPSAEEMVYETKDFLLAQAHRFIEFHIDARKGPFYVSHSLDGGLVWSSETTFSFSNDWSVFVYYLNQTTRMIRFRIRSTANELDIRLLIPWYIPRVRAKTLVKGA